MHLKQVKIGELNDFIKSDTYRSLNVLPITPERAKSQSLNPDSDDEDVALIIAYNEQDEITGYIGILPGKIKPELPEKIYWNSCWWAHPKKGSGVAMALFFQMMKVTGRKMIFAELSPATKIILKSLPGFVVPEPVEGLTGYILPDVTGFLKRRKLRNPVVIHSGCITESITSIFRQPAIAWRKHRLNKEAITSHEEIENMNQSEGEFIQKNQGKQLTIKTPGHFNWIKTFPWLIDKPGKEEKNLSKKYFFSWIVSGFQTKFYKIHAENRLVCILVMTNREGNCKIPYIYYDKEYTGFIVEEIYRILFEQKAKSISLFHQDLIETIKEFPNPFFYTRKIIKQTAWSEDLGLSEEDVILQDGDGDAVFT
ncbi:MAG: hypothetical protein ACOCXD_02540 [Bacteroidota bacterium]